MSDMITENHQIYTFEHEMNVEGNHLVEKKQKTITEPKDSENSGGTTVLVHIRSIGERIVKIIETTREKQCEVGEVEIVVETNLTELVEAQEFEQDWQRLWSPTLNELQNFLLICNF